jgi:RNA polymerase sigma factor
VERLLLLLFKRFLSKTGLSASTSDKGTETPEAVLLRIKEGDREQRDTFIAAYQPYVAKVTSRFCKRYIDPSRDDEFSIALLAFNEAIDQFSPTAGRSFLGFAETVIRRRLIDHVRREQRHAHVAPFSAFDTEDDDDFPVNPVETRQALSEYGKQTETEERRNEIEEFGVKLLRFGIKFSELADVSPKHIDSRLMLFGIGRQIARSPELYLLMESKRQLPIKILLESTSVSRKTLERNRKFLIAIALIYNGSYPFLQAYLQIPDEEPLSEEGVGV